MKNVKTIVAACIALFVLTTNSIAQTSKNSKQDFEVKFLGNDDAYLTFEVKLLNDNREYAALKINEKNEGEIFSAYWGKNTIVKTFKIEKKDYKDLTFNMQIGKSTYSKTFTVNTQIIEKVAVNEKDVVTL
jgi:hypothetical protein